MEIHSTSKMLARMGQRNSNAPQSAESEVDDLFDCPQLTPNPSPNMANELNNILGASASKKHSPMD